MQVSESYSPEIVSAVLQVENINGVNVNTFKIKCSNLPLSYIGDKISADIEINSIENPSLKRYYSSDNIFLQGEYIDNYKKIGNNNRIDLLLKQLQIKLSNNFKKYLNNENAGILSAIVLGEKSGLTNEIKDKYSAVGVSHILVVSGMHLSIIAGIVVFILGKFINNFRVLAGVSSVFIIIYMCFTGLTPSVFRAGMAILFLLVARIFLYDSDTLTSISFALIIMLLISPYSSLDVGLWFSYFATLAILAHNRMLISKKVHSHIKILLIPIFVIIFTLPIQILLNGNVSIIGVLVNVIVVPLLAPLLLMGFILLFTCYVPFLYPITFIVTFLINVIMFGINSIIDIANNIPFASIPVGGYLVLLTVFLIYLVGAILSYYKSYKAMVIIQCVLLVVSISLSVFINYNTTKIIPIGSSVNPAIIIQKNREVSVIYKGTQSNISQIEEYLRKNNIKEISYLFDIDNSDNTHILKRNLNIKEYIISENYYNTTNVFNKIKVHTRKQENSTICFIDVNGYVVATTNGKINYEFYPRVNVFIGGNSEVQSLKCDTLLFTGKIKEFESELFCNDIRSWQQECIIWIRNNMYVTN